MNPFAFGMFAYFLFSVYMMCEVLYYNKDADRAMESYRHFKHFACMTVACAVLFILGV